MQQVLRPNWDGRAPDLEEMLTNKEANDTGAQHKRSTCMQQHRRERRHMASIGQNPCLSRCLHA